MQKSTGLRTMQLARNRVVFFSNRWQQRRILEEKASQIRIPEQRELVVPINNRKER